MNQELVAANGAEIIERVVIAGDLSRLSPADRVAYYRATCDSLGLNSLTKPFEYIELNGKLTLYATRTATDQLRELKRVSLRPVLKQLNSELNVYIVEVEATTPDGRTDFATGVVSIAREDGTWETSQNGKRFFKGNGQWKQMRGDDLANAIMKCETKAKRRATLSVCGLGWMDETEVETVAAAQRVYVDTTTGVVVDSPQAPQNGHSPPASDKQRSYITGLQDKLGWHSGQVEEFARERGIHLATMYATEASTLIEGLKMLAEERGKPVERPLVKRLRELVADCRGVGVPIPDLPKPRDMTDEQIDQAIQALEVEYSKAQQAADAVADDLTGDVENLFNEPVPVRKSNRQAVEDLL